MKVILIILFCLSYTTFAQDSTVSRITVFYFGGTDCGYCMRPENILRIKKMREELPTQYNDTTFKFVLVAMDEEIMRGVEYTKKYPRWDEVSIGQWYNNELMLEHVNKTTIPGVPHIMIYEDALVAGKGNVPTIKTRTLLKDLVGVGQINTWMTGGYRLKE